jgi:hypothetical protein
VTVRRSNSIRLNGSLDQGPQLSGGRIDHEVHIHGGPPGPMIRAGERPGEHERHADRVERPSDGLENAGAGHRRRAGSLSAGKVWCNQQATSSRCVSPGCRTRSRVKASRRVSSLASSASRRRTPGSRPDTTASRRCSTSGEESLMQSNLGASPSSPSECPRGRARGPGRAGNAHLDKAVRQIGHRDPADPRLRYGLPERAARGARRPAAGRVGAGSPALSARPARSPTLPQLEPPSVIHFGAGVPLRK